MPDSLYGDPMMSGYTLSTESDDLPLMTDLSSPSVDCTSIARPQKKQGSYIPRERKRKEERKIDLGGARSLSSVD